MDNLRWILLAAGIFFILAIYFVGRQRHRHNNNSDLFDSKEELPEFSARDWDDLDEGVGEVRVVTSEDYTDDYVDDFSDNQVPLHDSEIMPETYESEVEDNQEPELVTSDDLFVLKDEVDESLEEQSEVKNNETKSEQPKSSSVDIIVLYILAKPSEVLSGEKINSVAQANGFVFGSMNIYHCHDANGQTIFSLANMMEPGNFDPDSIHEMTTSGLTVFMQLSNLTLPVDDFDEMLRSAYHMAEMLGANLCNQNRQPFTQADAEYYRSLIAEIENQ